MYNMSKVLTKSKIGSMFIIYVEPNDDKMNHNDIKTMMWDIADAMDRKHKGCIQIPSKYSSAFRNVYNDREDYPYLTTMSENVEQTNSIMLDLILRKYSRKYRKYLKSKRKMVRK